MDELPEACQNLRKATYECKRNMVRAPSETANDIVNDDY